MTTDDIKKTVVTFVDKYSIKSIVLFGSRANGTNTANSDVDLIVEFFNPVSLITLSKLKLDVEAALGLDVDIVHGPLSSNAMIEVGKEVVLYAA
ncbi:MAG: nucleotidyltransferase domain-containing protein [Salinivirgaceae bacterium]|nr:nucleotidyltransferase domain-containing protein [Salinivirgaceae bacterium]